MSKRAAVEGQKQEATSVGMSVAMQQLMVPLLLAMDATKKGLLAFVQQMGMVVLSELLVAEAAQIAGPKGKHIEGRTHHHWGTGTTPVCFGGRHVALPHPRVRERGKRKAAEVTLPSIEALRNADPMSARVVEQIALGVSTRGYERSLEPAEESIETRGTSKSNASRALIDATTEKLAQFVSRTVGGDACDRPAGDGHRLASPGFRRFWARKSRRIGRPALDREVVALIERMAQENRTWVDGELPPS